MILFFTEKKWESGSERSSYHKQRLGETAQGLKMIFILHFIVRGGWGLVGGPDFIFTLAEEYIWGEVGWAGDEAFMGYESCFVPCYRDYSSPNFIQKPVYWKHDSGTGSLSKNDINDTNIC